LHKLSSKRSFAVVINDFWRPCNCITRINLNEIKAAVEPLPPLHFRQTTLAGFYRYEKYKQLPLFLSAVGIFPKYKITLTERIQSIEIKHKDLFGT